LSTSSLATLGHDGVTGSARSGQSAEQAYVNAATGNLVLQTRDDYLARIGPDIDLLRTYNSQGQFEDAWAVGAQRQRIAQVSGGLLRTDHDGAVALYEWDASVGAFVSDAGALAYDRITASGGGWTWVDGASGLVETYGSDGRLLASTDADG